MWDFASRLFDPSGFPPRWHCGAWTPGHGWLHILSDVGIWAAYFVIPCVLGYYAVRRRGIPFRGVLVLFVAFILSCGLTHLMEAAIFWWPAYRLAGVLKLLTAVVSWATVFALIRVTPRVLAFRSPAELEAEIAERHRVEGDLRALQAQLEDRVRLRTAELEGAVAALKAENEERERVERQLWASREQLRLVTDNAPVMLVQCDTERRYKFVNRAYAACLGLTPREVVGRTIPEVVGGPAYALLRTNVDAALAGQRVEFEVASAYAGTEQRWLHYTYLPHHTDAGAVQGFLAVILDVTERRRAEELLRSITDTVPALIAYADTEGRYRLNNRAYEQWFGQPRSGMAGRHMRDVLGEPAWAVIGPRVEAALAGHTVRYEAEVPYRAGGMRWIDATYTPHVDLGGGIDGVVMLVNDITEKKEAENALRESERRFRQMADSIPQLAWTASPDGHIFWYNHRWYDYTGTTPDRMEGWGWQSVHDPDELPKVLERWKASIASGEPFEMVFPLRGADGRFRSFLTRVMPLRSPEGRVLQWFGTNTDIHEKKLAEEELRELNATLEHRVAQRTAEVEQRAKELRDQTRLLESIVSSVAEGVVVADENAKFLLFNPAAERMLGAGVTDAPVAAWSQTYGVFLPDGRTVFPPDQLPLARAIRGEPIDDVEMVARSPKQPEGIVLSVTGRPLYSDDGRGCGGVVVLHDITVRKLSEERTTASLREKEVLLKEIHHRVKNNLQLVSSLLNLQAGHTTDPAAVEMFKESRGRVKSMALIHERLYRSQDMARVDFGEYVRHLASDLHRTYRVSEGIRLELDVDAPPLAIDIAIPCGLLLNELISNCFKHAFADAAEGCLRVSLRRDGGANVLTVADDGAGFPAGTDFRDTASFGLQLVNTMVEQLDGEIDLTTGRGTTFTVRFPKPSSSQTGTLP